MLLLTRPRLALAAGIAAVPMAIASPVALAESATTPNVTQTSLIDPVSLLLSLLGTLSPAQLTLSSPR